MSIANLYANNPFVLSFELFPPKTDKGMGALVDNVARLVEFRPHFITCTYGAGGSSQSKTLETLAKVREISDVPLASHLTCVGATTDQLKAYLAKAAELGIENIAVVNSCSVAFPEPSDSGVGERVTRILLRTPHKPNNAVSDIGPINSGTSTLTPILAIWTRA